MGLMVSCQQAWLFCLLVSNSNILITSFQGTPMVFFIYRKQKDTEHKTRLHNFPILTVMLELTITFQIAPQVITLHRLGNFTQRGHKLCLILSDFSYMFLLLLIKFLSHSPALQMGTDKYK